MTVVDTRSVVIDRAAEMMRCSRRTVYYRIRAGKLLTIRASGSQRVLVSSIEAFLAAGRPAMPSATPQAER